ncbi:hypothetical protein [Sphingomonas sp. Sph1(2015)]|jgi:hypothetical protein|uniref:hypothetical protein n=1 Tax=Sphingomonas sp. Sph1(2015) TaxID=1628084 RepID=UPI0011156C97|nr:hypothetical protein [Sphingomonas sp. Sph1(2015)]
MISRTADEWVTVAKISKNIKHLFVEGESDARLLSHVYGYPDDVDLRVAREIERPDIQSHPLCGGFKLRLVDLAKSASDANIANLKCLVDSDFENLSPYVQRNANLFLTKYANLPVSTLQYEWTKAFLLKAYGFVLKDATWAFIVDTLHFCFVARYFSARSENPNSAPDMSKCVDYAKGLFSFNQVKYCSQFFDLNIKSTSPIIKKIKDEIDTINDDARRYINSNDTFDILHAILRASKLIGGGVSRDAVRQSFLGAADDDSLLEGTMDASQWANPGVCK